MNHYYMYTGHSSNTGGRITRTDLYWNRTIRIKRIRRDIKSLRGLLPSPKSISMYIYCLASLHAVYKYTDTWPWRQFFMNELCYEHPQLSTTIKALYSCKMALGVTNNTKSQPYHFIRQRALQLGNMLHITQYDCLAYS